MVKEGNSAASPLLRDIFSAAMYKRSQGRIARQATFAALFIALALGAWSLMHFLAGKRLGFVSENSPAAPWLDGFLHYGVPGLILVAGLWLCFRVVNVPRFADFLIAVEAEMNKVSWPTKTELIRSSAVVLVTIFSLSFILYAYDIFWRIFLSWLGVLAGN